MLAEGFSPTATELTRRLSVTSASTCTKPLHAMQGTSGAGRQRTRGEAALRAVHDRARRLLVPLHEFERIATDVCMV